MHLASSDTGSSLSFADFKRLVAEDWGRNVGPWSKAAVAVFRLGQFGRGRAGVELLTKMLDVVFMRVILGAELPPQVKCGGGLRLPHGARGVVVHPQVVLGRNVTLYHRVTIGVRGESGLPRLEDGVYVGTGACILGSVLIGAGSRIGANAVVVDDVAPGRTAVGVPATAITGPSEIGMQ